MRPAHVGLHAHQRVHARRGRAQELPEQLRLVAAAVLEVDEQPVEPGQPERLGGQRAAERQERPEQRLARGEAGLHARHGAESGPLTNTDTPPAAHPRRLAPPTMLNVPEARLRYRGRPEASTAAPRQAHRPFVNEP